MSPIITVIIALAACLIGGLVGYTYRKNYTEKKIDRTEEYAKRLYDDATLLVEQYNRDLAAWERQVHGGQQPTQAPPEKESIRKKLRDMEAEAKRRNAERQQKPRHRSYNYDRGR